jgi:ketosteroid isomerase-like protein
MPVSSVRAGILYCRNLFVLQAFITATRETSRSGTDGAILHISVDAQEVQHFEPREFIADGDKVVALGHYAWHVKATGREFGDDFAHVFTLCNGKVIRFQCHQKAD